MKRTGTPVFPGFARAQAGTCFVWPAGCRFVLLLPLLFLSSVAVHAQLTSIKCIRFTQEHGLSDDMIYCARQDRYGFLWLGTRDGLSRFDGTKFIVYRHRIGDVETPSITAFDAICEARDGSLWVTADNAGLDRFDRVTERFTHYRNPRKNAGGPTTSICEDSDGYIWFTTKAPIFALHRFDPRTGTFEQFRHNPDDLYSISSDMVSCVCSDSSGTIWVGTFDRGINRFDPKRNGFINHRTVADYSFDRLGEFGYLRAEKNGDLWIYGSPMAEIRLFRPRSGGAQVELIDLRDVMRDGDTHIISLLCDSRGVLWLGTGTQGLYIVDRKTGLRRGFHCDPADSYSLAGDRVAHVLEDHNNNIWVCTDGGLCRIHHRFYHIDNVLYTSSTDSPLPSAKVRSLLKEDGGSLWIGTESEGLVEWGGQNHTAYRVNMADRKAFRNTINTMKRTRNGELLLGTNLGVYALDENTGTLKSVVEAAANLRIWLLYEDRRGYLWVGTLFNGLLLLDPSRRVVRTFFREPFGATSGYSVFSAHEDDNGIMWLGGTNGLTRYDPATDSFEYFVHDPADPSSLSYNHVWSIHATADGMLWLGTSGGGLNRFDPRTKKFTCYSDRNGLPSNIICGIVEDHKKNLWISTNRGLCRFTPSNEKVIRLASSDGILISDFSFKNCCRDDRGYLYFGGRGGFCRFHPDSIFSVRTPPPLLFTAFNVMDRRIQPDTSLLLKKFIRLRHDQNFFSVEFAAMDLTNPPANRYRYRLEGVDRQWREAEGGAPVASYTDVPPGAYRFSLYGANSDGTWTLEPAVLSIVVEPAWWQTWWFRGVVLLTVLSTGMSVFVWRLRESQARTTMQRRMAELQLQALRAQLNPHFIFNALNSILSYIAASDIKKAQLYLTRFAKLIRAFLENSRSEFITLEEEVEVLELYLYLESMRFSDAFKYAVEIGPGIEAYSQEVPAMLIQPFVENAVKHGLLQTVQEGYIAVVFSAEQDVLVCRITDNGIGLRRAGELQRSTTPIHTSRGLALIQERIKTLRGLYGREYSVDIRDRSDDGSGAAGTCVEVRMPLAGDLQVRSGRPDEM